MYLFPLSVYLDSTQATQAILQLSIACMRFTKKETSNDNLD